MTSSGVAVEVLAYVTERLHDAVNMAAGNLDLDDGFVSASLTWKSGGLMRTLSLSTGNADDDDDDAGSVEVES
jgi:hypothetical protein